MTKSIYLDYAATTPVEPSVLADMIPFFSDNFGNPLSVHQIGQAAESALEDSREAIANLMDCEVGDIIFTSCGTESDNLAIRGAAHAARHKRSGNHILISPVEHHAVLHTAQQLAELEGFELEFLPVDEYGRVTVSDVARLIRDDTAIVSVVYANNEIGTVNPIADISRACQKRGVPFHTDAVQAAAHIPIQFNKDGIDLLSIGAHKFYGPKGVGALIRRQSTPIIPTQTGGKQEGHMRAGTQNIPLIVGMASALNLARRDMEARNETFVVLRDRLIDEVVHNIPGAHLTGHPTQRLPNHASFVFEGVDGNHLLMMLDAAGFACSSGSACKVGDPQPSSILLAIGLSPQLALGSLRVTLGKHTTQQELDAFLNALPEAIHKSKWRRSNAG
jgi:cysteine desulfurase